MASQEEIDFTDKIYSLNDLVHALVIAPEKLTSLTFQVQLPDTNDDLADVDSK